MRNDSIYAPCKRMQRVYREVLDFIIQNIHMRSRL